MGTRKERMKKYFKEEQLAGLRKCMSPEMKAESDRGLRWLEVPKRPSHAARSLPARLSNNWHYAGKGRLDNSRAAIQVGKKACEALRR
jgi:hypothetical protein